jgi:hypothetical protein
MTKMCLATAVSAAFIAAAQPLSAQKGHAPKSTAPTIAHGPSSQGVKPASSGHVMKPTAQTHGSKSTTSSHGPKTTASSHGPKTTASSHGSKPAKPAHADKIMAGKPHSKTTATSSPAGTPLTRVQQKLQKNTQLAAKVQSRLPAGTDLMAASDGFKNLGQFVAAVNVSHNLGIPFDQLKTNMVVEGSSLGQSIQTLKTSANSDVEVQRAAREANTMIAEAEKLPASKTPKSSKKTITGTTSHAPRQ